MTILLSAEMLEQRLVMAAAPPPVDLSTATSNVATAQGNLLSALNTFVSNMTSAENTLSTDYQSHATAFANAMVPVIATFNSNVDGIDATLNGVLTGLANAFNGLVAGHQATFDGDITAALNDFNANMAGPLNALLAAYAGAQGAFDATVATANGTLDAAVDGFRATLDGTVDVQETTLQTNINGENSSFQSFVAGEQTTYNSAELGFWNAYLTAVGLSPIGLEGIYNSAVASAASVRDGVLASYPNVTYDPSILFGTSAYTALIDAANATLAADLAQAAIDYDNAVTAHNDAFQNAIFGPSGAMIAYNNLIDVANMTFDSTMAAADLVYGTAIGAAQTIYDNAVNGPGGLQDIFDANVATITDDYYDTVGMALDTMNGQVSAAETVFQGLVTLAEGAYNDWLSGTLVGGIQIIATKQHFQTTSPDAEWWEIVTVYSDPLGKSISITQKFDWNRPVIGTAVSTNTTSGLINGLMTTVTTEVTTNTISETDPNVGNPFEIAMDELTGGLLDDLGLLETELNEELSDLQDIFQTAADAANAQYESDASGPTAFGTVYSDAWTNALDAAMSAIQPYWTSYQFEAANYNAAMMLAMMNGTTPPDPTAILTATQEYQLNVLAEQIGYVDTVGGDFETYVGAERTADDTRDLAIISAINDYLEDAINAVDAYQAAALPKLKTWLDDMTDVQAAFELADLPEWASQVNKISDAAKAFALAENAAHETFDLAEAAAFETQQQGIAGEVETFRNGEMGQRIPLMQSGASAAEDWDEDLGGAQNDWVYDEASAADHRLDTLGQFPRSNRSATRHHDSDNHADKHDRR